MTKQEKIDILWKMMKLNFQRNFNNTGLTYGLCTILRRASNYSHMNLLDAIPEIYQHRHISYDPEGYWWPSRHRFKSWWYRHVAIWKTIRQLKKS